MDSLRGGSGGGWRALLAALRKQQSRRLFGAGPCPALAHRAQALSSLLAEIPALCLSSVISFLPRDDDGPGPVPEGLEPRVIEVYRGVGKLLSRYSAGKVPKVRAGGGGKGKRERKVYTVGKARKERPGPRL